MATAIAECAFNFSTLPVILSLEMHSTPRQQRNLCELFVKHMGSSLTSYDELAATGRDVSLSPLDFQHRILLKGKVRLQVPPNRKQSSGEHRLSNAFATSIASRASAPSNDTADVALASTGKTSCVTASKWVSKLSKTAGPSGGSMTEQVETRGDEDARLRGESTDFDCSDPHNVVNGITETRQKLYNGNGTGYGKPTDPFYSSYLALRMQSLAAFCSDAPPQ